MLWFTTHAGLSVLSFSELPFVVSHSLLCVLDLRVLLTRRFTKCWSGGPSLHVTSKEWKGKLEAVRLGKV